MENTADETSLFCLEIFVDTVDYLQLSTDAKQPEPTDFVFIFAGYPPLVVPAPDTIAQPNAASWVTTRLGKKRYRVTYQSGKSALFEAQPTDLAAKLRCRPLQVLALSSEDAEIGTASGRPHRRLRGSCAVPMASSSAVTDGVVALMLAFTFRVLPRLKWAKACEPETAFIATTPNFLVVFFGTWICFTLTLV